jgi:hypothetical protein
MLQRKHLLLIAILSLILLLAANACTAADIQSLEGMLQNVDSVSGNVTVKLKDGTTKAFNFTDVKLETIKQALGKAGFEIGDNVTIKLDRHGEVKSLETHCAEVDGVIKSLGTNNVTITSDKKDITLTVTTNTTISIGDKGASKFSDLKVGQKVEAKYDLSSLKASRITIDLNEENNQNQDHPTIKGINTDNKTSRYHDSVNNNSDGQKGNDSGRNTKEYHED